MKSGQKQIRWWRVGVWALAGLALGALSGRLWLAIFTLLVFGGARLIGELSRPKPQPTEPETPPLSDQMAKHYEQSGLAGNDVKVFRDTMDTASDQIQAFEAVTQRVPKLRAIATNADLSTILHAYFKAIVANPKKLSAAGHFIYEMLPNLLSIAQKYETISHHEVKTDDTFAVLTTAGNTISDLAGKIRIDYANFVETDLDDLEADIDLAKKQAAEIPESTQPLNRRVNLTDPIKEEMEHPHD
ncbi:5-bromo-4-chloroindolyl phosphate hydrolysis family protein [Lacticaseibacillus mingshuiensis]|uniref:5-bromo-4-chloroindolyl phosphate hydrolysis family protein n=1 Tax=Lacticaseibacillus mingshuiensis TaxID=2799574 RepID=A0ABW4CJI9_9LACO|nr:5-bromo-4-chloroindolyl phosphate hydrolysis family protein [Lacticaseibacillus mingshuiensis]